MSASTSDLKLSSFLLVVQKTRFEDESGCIVFDTAQTKKLIWVSCPQVQFQFGKGKEFFL